MQELLLQLQKEQQRTIVFVSHDLDEAFHIGNRIAIMEGGRIVQVGTPNEILRNPSDAYVRAFFKGVDVKKYLLAQDVARMQETLLIRPSADARADMAQAVEKLRSTRRNYAFVVGEDARLLGGVSLDTLLRGLESGANSLDGLYLDDMDPVPAALSLNALIGRIVRHPLPLPVVDAQQRYLGAVTQTVLLQKMVDMDMDAQARETGNE
jgi:glycine betaine/proline transport system ATP-binding protein